MLTDIDSLFDELFPICRSITGEGIRQSMNILGRYMPLEIHSIPTGTQVFDWTVPREWKLNRATLTAPNGETVLDTNTNNLHVLNYSIPFSGELDLADLQDNLFSIPEMPDAIPYVTSYYKERWGLCLTDEQRKNLPQGKYTVNIDTELKNGELNYATCELPGKTSETILITSYLCHPGLANNELSGPLCLLRLYELLKAIPDRRYTYKFVLLPETIGSISFLWNEGKALRDRVKAGLVLTCIGGPGKTVSFKLSRKDWLGEPSDIDELARHVAEYTPSSYSVRDFDPTAGSDERQFCSPGVNLPFIQAAKTIYGEYAEYHTSKDDKELMSIAAVESSCEQLFDFLRLFEIADQYIESNIEAGEPQLGKRDLYPTVNGPATTTLSNDSTTDGRGALNTLLRVISLSDGKHTILTMAEKLQLSAISLLPHILKLISSGVVKPSRSKAL